MNTFYYTALDIAEVRTERYFDMDLEITVDEDEVFEMILADVLSQIDTMLNDNTNLTENDIYKFFCL